jgi:hypothetical protein
MGDGLFWGMVSLMVIVPGYYAHEVPKNVAPTWTRDTQQVVQPYKEGGRQIANPVLDYRLADEKCPSGWGVRNQETQVDGTSENLVFTLRCR